MKKDKLYFRCAVHLGSAPVLEHDGRASYRFDLEGLVILGKVRLDNFSELCVDLGSESTSHLEIVLAMWIKWGEKCLDYLYGDFSFCIIDQQKRTIFAARDQLGVRPFYYYQNEGSFYFSTSLKALVEMEGIPKSLDEQWQIRYLNSLKAHPESTIYKDVFRLKPAHSLTIQNSKTEIHSYWQLERPEEKNISLSEAVEGLKKHLQRAVNCRLPEVGALACELSGGIDSTTITAFSSLSKSCDIFTFSHALNDEDYKTNTHKDERVRIKHLCDQYQLNNELIDDCGQGVLSDLLLHCSLLASPPKINIALNSHRLFERAQAKNCTVVFSGFGGDECISMRSPGTIMNEFIQNKNYKHLMAELKIKRPLLCPLLFIYHILRCYTKPKVRILKKEINSFLIKEEYRLPQQSTQISNENTFKRAKSLLPDRLATSERMGEMSEAAEYYGLEYRFPFMDLQFIQFWLALPAKFKLNKGRNRYILRTALKGIIPDTIRLADKEPGHTVPSALRRNVISNKNKEVIINQLPWLIEEHCRKVVEGIHKEKPIKPHAPVQQARYLSAFYNSQKVN